MASAPATNALKMLGGGNRKPALINSWNWPRIPSRFLSLVGQPSISDLSPNSGPLLRLNLDAATYTGSGDWIDSIAQRHFVLQNTPTYNGVDAGGCFTFQASLSQYALCTSSILPALQSWSIVVWHFYTGNITGNSPCIVAEKYVGENYINYAFGCISSNPILNAGFYNSASGGNWNVCNGSAIPTPNTWYQLVATLDTNNDMTMYVNAVATSTANLPAVRGSSEQGIVLMRRWDQANYWDGKLAIVQIYEGALTPEAISANFEQNKGRFGLP